ncbi:hypothetical protein D3C75_596240 [compost metagenome]
MEWNTVRCKVECAPFHSKVIDLEPKDILPFQYFESHIPVRIRDERSIRHLQIACAMLEMHMSANAFKVQDNERTIMTTYRSSDVNAEQFRAATDRRVEVLSGQHASYEQYCFNVSNPVVEFAIFDSNRSHDNQWIEIVP